MEIWGGSVLFDPYELPIKTEQAFICCGTELQTVNDHINHLICFNKLMQKSIFVY